MHQYDVFRVLDGTLFVVLQADYWTDDPAIKIVAPLRPAKDVATISRVDVPIRIDGVEYVARMSQLGAIQVKTLHSEILANVADQHDAFIAAIDLIFLGF